MDQILLSFNSLFCLHVVFVIIGFNYLVKINKMYLECISDINDKGVMAGTDRVPLVTSKNLEASDLILMKNGQGSGIRVWTCPKS